MLYPLHSAAAAAAAVPLCFVFCVLSLSNCLPAGYDEGNLSWLAALEAEPATDVMALLPWAKNELTLTGPEAQVHWSGMHQHH